VVAGALAGLAIGLTIWRQRSSVPATLTGPNILQNNDFALDADGDGIPDGWTTAGVDGVQYSEWPSLDGAGRTLYLAGINNYLASPSITVQSNQRYRVAFRALADNPDKPSPTQLRVRFHWRDDEGVVFSVARSAWQTVPHRQWATVVASATAPAEAVQLSVSLHPASDDRIVLDDFQMGQLGVRVEPWPEGKRAALAFSFDYETAMGGLIHSRSGADDPYAAENALERAARMRAGVDTILALFAPRQIRGTWYTNGYNFLRGNRERRVFMNNPTYEWANTANRWPSDHWTTTPWFSPDPYTDEATDPVWYFGSQVALLRRAAQDIQSHTFAHFDGGLVRPEDWRDDFAAWNDVAAAHDVAPATSIAFPWSSSAGMRWDSWQVLADQGIRSVTRTNWNQKRFAIADRERYAVRALPGRPMISVVADAYLTPDSIEGVRRALASAQLNGGAIDVWAHTEEVTTPEQQAVWTEVVEASDAFWVASVPDIAAWHRAIRDVRVELVAETPQYTFRVVNGNVESLDNVGLRLPFVPERIAVGGQSVPVTGDRLILDLAGRDTVEVTLWRAS
jgi:hypothetical protein